MLPMFVCSPIDLFGAVQASTLVFGHGRARGAYLNCLAFELLTAFQILFHLFTFNYTGFVPERVGDIS
jgi:hypothetical protein